MFDLCAWPRIESTSSRRERKVRPSVGVGVLYVCPQKTKKKPDTTAASHYTVPLPRNGGRCYALASGSGPRAQVEHYQLTNLNLTMTYIQESEKQFRAKLASGDAEALVTFFKSKILESYANGIERGKRLATQTEPINTP